MSVTVLVNCLSYCVTVSVTVLGTVLVNCVSYCVRYSVSYCVTVLGTVLPC